MPIPTFAIDARLISTRNTGDTSYWRGLINGLSKLHSNDARFLLLSNVDRPAGIPDSEQFQWQKVTSRNRLWWSLVAFPLAAKRHRAAAIHTQYSLSPLVGSRGVTTIHDISPMINPAWFSEQDSARFGRQIPASCRIANQIITVSQTSKAEIESFIPAAKGKVSVTYNGPSEFIQPIDRQSAKNLVSERLKISGPYVFTLGTRWKRKNTALAIEAVEHLDAVLPHRLVVTGQAYGDETEEPGRRTVWTGYLDDEMVSALYSGADAYLAPSLHEGFGIPVLEAFACGCPVVASSGGALPEVVGDAGEIVPDFDPATWAERLTSVLTDPSKVIGMRQRGFERLSQFDWAKTAQQTLDVYRKVGQL